MTDIAVAGGSKLDRRCETCAFYDHDGLGDGWLGECRRQPPEHKKGWPEVSVTHWCGEYEPGERGTSVPADAPLHPGAHMPPAMLRSQIFDALLTLFRAADAGILPEGAHADLARLRIAITLAFPPSATPGEPRL